MNIFFHPQYPDKEYYGLTQIMHRLGYTASLDPDADFDLAFYWHDVTHEKPLLVLEEIARHHPVVNRHCRDISKNRVESVCVEVLGYGLAIDPLSHHGAAVEKPDNNGVKGGRVVECPLEAAEAGKIYQALVDSRVDGYQCEYRVPVVLGTLPIAVLVKQDFPADNPIDNPLASLDIRKQLPPEPMALDDCFSAQEQQQILQVCEAMGLDFGELDVVRCSKTQRIHVLDVNKTAAGYGLLNRFYWRAEDKDHVLQTLAKAFAETVKRLTDNPEDHQR